MIEARNDFTIADLVIILSSKASVVYYYLAIDSEVRG